MRYYRIIFCFVFYLFVCIGTFAYNACIDGIYYNFSETGATVTYGNSNGNSYSGSVIIPMSVTYKDYIYRVTSIGESAFYNCANLTSITIPNSVTSIGESAFAFCANLTSIIVNSGNTVYDSRTNCNAIIKTATNMLIVGCNNTTIPSSVTSIGKSAFYGCSNLTSITIPNSVTSIGESAFCECSHLTSVIIPNSVTSIRSSTFQRCTCLPSVTIPNSVTSIGESAFANCNNLASVTIPNSVTSIGKSAFRDCNNLTSVTIGVGVLSIGDYAFDTTSSKKIIWLANTPPTGYKYAAGTINYVANNQYSLSNITIYPYLSSLFEVDGVKYVPVSPSERTCDAIDCAYNESAENIYIGKTVTYNGVSLSVKQVKPYFCYNNKFIKSLNCNNCSYIGDYAFGKCTNMTSAICNNLGDIGSYAFSGCSRLTNTVCNNLGDIGAYSFSECRSLKNAVCNNNGNIENNAFSWCEYMTELTLGNEVSSIGQESFKKCYSLESVFIPNSVTTIGDYAFSNCQSLANISLGNKVETIGSYAFENCIELQAISIPASVKSINNYAFKNVYHWLGLRTFIIADRENELSLGSNGSSPLFADCPLDSVYIGGNISYNTSSSCGYSPFYRNTFLRTVVIMGTETEISPNEFYGCTNLKNVRIGDSVTTFGDWAFSGCSSLDYFSFGSSVKTIGKEAFSDCTAMTSLISKATTPPTCDSQAFDDINKWNCTLTVPQGSMAAYQQANQWKDFFFIEEFNPNTILATGISLNQTTLSFSAANQTATLIATVTPSNATNKNVTWTSSNTAVATVSSAGVVTSKANGTAVITAKTTDGTNLTATCNVTVSIPVLSTGISLNETTLSFNAVNQTATLIATITPSNATNKNVTWTSSNTSVATVSSSGVVTAKGNGSAIITAQTTDGTNLTATCNVTVTIEDNSLTTTTINGITYYKIKNAVDIMAFTALVNEDEICSANAILTANIDLSGVSSNWTPIGNADAPYTGIFDGQGHAITGFEYTATSDCNGLFGFINNATIKNFSISGTLTSEKDWNGVVGRADGASVVSGIHSSLMINVSNYKAHTGGVVGGSSNVQGSQHTVLVEGCEYSGTLTHSGEGDCQAGIIGYTYGGGVKNCIFSGTIIGGSSNYGGILGYCKNVNFIGVQNCLSVGKIVTDAGCTTAAAIIGNWNGNATLKVKNNYYCLQGGPTTNIGIGNKASNCEAPYAVTAAQLASGEVCYALNGDQTEINWYQTLGVDAHPVLNCNHSQVFFDATTGNFRNEDSATILATGISLNKTTLSFYAANQTATLTATITPTNATNKNVTWTSSNTSVATVSSSGVVTAKGNGTAVITAKTTDGTNLTATCNVTVSIDEILNDSIIIFADANVKAICVANWDTNGDGEIAFKEITAVTDLGTVFRHTQISSFDELQYFTGLTSIASSAFYGCSSLTSITIGSGVTGIASDAFHGCSSLTSITIGSGVTGIGNYAFSSCSSLTSITIPEGVKNIGSSAFSGCSALTTVTIPNSVISIGDYHTFLGCSSLISITIPEGVKNIGSSAFSGCSSLTSITIGSGVTGIGDRAFSGCSALTSITIPEGVTSIGSDTFYGCSSLRSITIPEGVTSIGDWAFDGCSALTSITIPEGVTNIGNSAFAWCSSLTSITIPEGVTAIGNQTFSSCSSLTSITIPEGVTNIGNYAFSNCRNLTSFTIPEGVTNIGSSAFAWCSNLKTIYCYAEAPPTIFNDTFSGVNVSKVILIVPDNAEDKYWAHEYWRQFWIETPTGISLTPDLSHTYDREEKVNGKWQNGKFNLAGQRLSQTQKGINIIRYADGTSKKVLIK